MKPSLLHRFWAKNKGKTRKIRSGFLPSPRPRISLDWFFVFPDRIMDQQEAHRILGPRLRALRRAQRLKLSVIAAGAGLSPGAYSKIERGLTVPPPRPVLLRILTALYVPGPEAEELAHIALLARGCPCDDSEYPPEVAALFGEIRRNYGRLRPGWVLALRLRLMPFIDTAPPQEG